MNNFQIIDYGSFGDIYKAIWKTKDVQMNIVVKKYRDCVKECEIEKEVDNLSSVNHENIVTLYGYTKDDDKRIIMVMEYADCGSLYDVLHKRAIDVKHIPEHQKISWMIQCAKVNCNSRYLFRHVSELIEYLICRELGTYMI